MLQNLLKETDATDGLSLDAPCFTVTGVVAAVSLGTGLRKVFLHCGVDLVDKVAEFCRYFVVSLF